MRWLRSLAIVAGLAAVFAGLVLYVRRWLAERGRKIDEAEEKVASALDGLDPIARVQVLKDAAKDVAG
jgi:hypothetical protein